MIFADINKNRPDQILFVGQYFKYWISGNGEERIHNPNFDEFSKNILNLKNGQEYAITYFLNRLKGHLGDDFVVCCVPSHDPENTQSGIQIVAQKLANPMSGIVDGTGCLVRTRKIAKLSGGGNRNIDVHLNSMEVRSPKVIHNKEVLLLDDVTTTHGSLLACKQLLQQAGAKCVQCLALGQTAA